MSTSERTVIFLSIFFLVDALPNPATILVEDSKPSDASTRLPRDVVPLHYKLEIQPLMEEGKFQGHVVISVQCREETDKMTLHADSKLRIDESKVSVKAEMKYKRHQLSTTTTTTTVAPVPVGAARLLPQTHFISDVTESEHGIDSLNATTEEVDLNEEVIKLEPVSTVSIERNSLKQWLVIHMGRHLQRDQKFILEIHFSGELTSDPANGIYMESYTDLTSRERRAYIATQMQERNARKVFPCFDEPSYKVPMEITIVAINLYTVLSNMPEKSSFERGDWVGHEFQESPPISTFSVAFTIFNLKLLVFDVAEDAPIRFYGRQELNDLPNTARVLKAATISVESIKEYLDYPLPTPKMDFVILPGANSFSDSNFGLVFLSESQMTCSHCVNPQITRDVANQWMGHSMTPHTIEEPDINKALVNFLALHAELKLDVGITASSRLWQTNYPLYYEFSKSSRYGPGLCAKNDQKTIVSELMLKMFNYTLTPSTFQAGMQFFARQRSFKTYVDNDVWSALTLLASSEKTLTGPGTVNQIAHSWLHVGRIPYVKVTRDYDKMTAEAEQRAFLRDIMSEESDQLNEDFWWIPLVVVPQNKLQFDMLQPKKWMDEEARVVLQGMPSSSYFIIVNPEEVGPFIVNYDRKNWFLISEYLDRNLNNQQIPEGTRAKLVHDALNLAFSGKLRFDSALNVTRFLFNEKESIVWIPACNMFDHILRQLEGTETAKKLQEYIKIILEYNHRHLNTIATPLNEVEDRMKTNGRALLCASGWHVCVDQSREAWKIWMISSDPDAGIPINLSHFCWVFKFGTQAEWEFGLERFKNFPSHLKQSDRFFLLQSLVSCPSSSANIDKLINATLLDPQNQDSDVSFLLSAISSDVAYKVLFNILDDNWDVLRNRYNTKESRLWEYIVSTATMNFKNQDGFEMVSELAQQRQGEFGKVGPIIEQALRRIKRHVKWAEDHRIIIDQWLDGYLKKHQEEKSY